MTFYVTSNSESSSLLAMGLHSEIYPEISVIHERQVETRRLDDLPQINEVPFDFINLDLQGVELKALRSLGKHLEKCEWIYVEVNKIELYEDGTIIHDLDTYFSKNGFKRVSTRWIWGAGWGDAIYFREVRITLRVQFAALFLRVEWLSLNCSRWIRAKTPSKFEKSLKKLLS